MISIIITTRNKQRQLIKCLKSISICYYQQYEIIVIDQTDKNIPQKFDKLKNSKVKYLYQSKIGKSIALNYAISKAKGDILVFTDDDCIVDKRWLYYIDKYFKENTGINAVFGRTFPYQPQVHDDLVCPALTYNMPRVIEKHRQLFTSEIGKGNNMAWRKTVLENLGHFKTWLGPGAKFSIAGGEETEMIYRALLHGYKIGHNPEMMVYHNKWITKEENIKLIMKKSLGNIAFLTYYFLKNHDCSLLKKTLIFHVNLWYLIKGYIIGIYAFMTNQ